MPVLEKWHPTLAAVTFNLFRHCVTQQWKAMWFKMTGWLVVSIQTTVQMIFTSVNLPSAYSRALHGIRKIWNVLDSLLMCSHRKYPGFGLCSMHSSNIPEVTLETCMGLINFKFNRRLSLLLNARGFANIIWKPFEEGVPRFKTSGRRFVGWWSFSPGTVPPELH